MQCSTYLVSPLGRLGCSLMVTTTPQVNYTPLYLLQKSSYYVLGYSNSAYDHVIWTVRILAHMLLPSTHPRPVIRVDEESWSVALFSGLWPSRDPLIMAVIER